MPFEGVTDPSDPRSMIGRSPTSHDGTRGERGCLTSPQPRQPKHSPPRVPGFTVERRQTEAGSHPFDAVEWEIRDAVIGNPDDPAFEQRGVEFPATWSQNATNIVAQKYFRGRMDSPTSASARSSR